MTILAMISILSIALPAFDRMGDNPDDAVDIGKNMTRDLIEEVAGEEAIRTEIIWIFIGALVTLVSVFIVYLQKHI